MNTREKLAASRLLGYLEKQAGLYNPHTRRTQHMGMGFNMKDMSSRSRENGAPNNGILGRAWNNPRWQQQPGHHVGRTGPWVHPQDSQPAPKGPIKQTPPQPTSTPVQQQPTRSPVNLGNVAKGVAMLNPVTQAGMAGHWMANRVKGFLNR